MPENLCEHYPQLAEIALPRSAPPEPKQSDLAFGTLPAEEEGGISGKSGAMGRD